MVQLGWFLGGHEMLPALRRVMVNDPLLDTDTPGTVLDALHTSAPFMPNNCGRGRITHILLIQAQSGDLSWVTWLLEHKARTQTSNLEMF